MSCKNCCKKEAIKNKLGIDLEQLKDFGGSQAAKAADDEEDEKKSHIGLVILAIVGIIAIGCIVGYIVYRHFSPDYLEDFDDEFEDDDFEDEDFFADEADN